jgi:hypothetical protein
MQEYHSMAVIVFFLQEYHSEQLTAAPAFGCRIIPSTPHLIFVQVFILQNLHATIAQLLILLTFARDAPESRKARGTPSRFFACVHFAHVSLRRIGPGADAEGAASLVT